MGRITYLYRAMDKNGSISFDLIFGAGLFGSATDAKPGSMVVIQKTNLLKVAGEPSPPAHLIVDASKVNPERRAKVVAQKAPA
jgi:hypothetical protein